MGKIVITGMVLFMALLLAACGSTEESLNEAVTEDTVITKTSNMNSQKAKQDVMIPQEIEEIPDEYFKVSEQPGRLKYLYYDTFESFSYDEKSKPLKKRAVVYLPYGYNKDQKYSVFYLMHGGWGDETTMIGTPDNPSSFKNVIDNAIAAGEIESLIIVCPTAMEYIYNGMKAFWSGKGKAQKEHQEVRSVLGNDQSYKAFTADTRIEDVIKDPAFGNFGRLLFPVNKRYYSGDTLGKLSFTWYGRLNPNRTVEIVNYLKERAESGETVFYDIYSDEEKAQDPDKKNTGLFFFRGKKGAKTAIVNAGGGFVYVGAMQDSFPHALELSKRGYNAFALIYRPGAQAACEDLARAIAFLHENADKLGIDMQDYSLWGGSAGARMAAWLGSYGTESFGEKRYPRPAAVIMQYTGLSEVTGKEPPTFACVGTNDGIASYKTMEDRINRIKANGTDAEIKVFQGLSHGFGLGEGTIAEGWIDDAIKFWEKHMKK